MRGALCAALLCAACTHALGFSPAFSLGATAPRHSALAPKSTLSAPRICVSAHQRPRSAIQAAQMAASGEKGLLGKVGDALWRLPYMVRVVMISIVAFMALFLSGPNKATAGSLGPAQLAPSAIVQQAESRPLLRTSEGESPALIVAKANNKGGKGKKADAPNVMLSMNTKEQKQRLAAAVSGAYIAVWAFFYFTHDAGEVSE